MRYQCTGLGVLGLNELLRIRSELFLSRGAQIMTDKYYCPGCDEFVWDEDEQISGPNNIHHECGVEVIPAEEWGY